MPTTWTETFTGSEDADITSRNLDTALTDTEFGADISRFSVGDISGNPQKSQVAEAVCYASHLGTTDEEAAINYYADKFAISV